MYKDVLRAIEGVDIFPVISLILFFSFFVGLIYYVMKTDKKIWDKAAALPLEAETVTNKIQGFSELSSDSLNDSNSGTSSEQLNDTVSGTEADHFKYSQPPTDSHTLSQKNNQIN